MNNLAIDLVDDMDLPDGNQIDQVSDVAILLSDGMFPSRIFRTYFTSVHVPVGEEYMLHIPADHNKFALIERMVTFLESLTGIPFRIITEDEILANNSTVLQNIRVIYVPGAESTASLKDATLGDIEGGNSFEATESSRREYSSLPQSRDDLMAL